MSGTEAELRYALVDIVFIRTFTAVSRATQVKSFTFQNLNFEKNSYYFKCCLYLTYRLHHGFPPNWPSSDVLRLLVKLMHLYYVSIIYDLNLKL
jgi:hypothetical protein